MKRGKVLGDPRTKSRLIHLNDPNISQWNVEIPYQTMGFKGLFSMNGVWDYLGEPSKQAMYQPKRCRTLPGFPFSATAGKDHRPITCRNSAIFTNHRPSLGVLPVCQF